MQPVMHQKNGGRRIPRPPPSGYSGSSSRTKPRVQGSDDYFYFAKKALEIQEKEIRKLERRLDGKNDNAKFMKSCSEGKENEKEDALLATNRNYNKEDKMAIDMIDWVRNYCEGKSKGTLDTFSDLFDGFDTSRDGFLSRDEFKIRMRDLGGFERVATPHFDRAFDMIGK